jgi:5'-nucleotidase
VDACLTPDGRLDRARTVIHPPLPLCLDAWQSGGCDKNGTGAVGPALFAGAPVEPDGAMTTLLAPYRQAAAALIDTPLGVELPRALRRESGEPTLGWIMSEGMRLAAQADAAVQNLGGVRADLPKGALRYGQAFEVEPFGNAVARLTMSGQQLMRLVATLYAVRHRPPHLAGAQLSADGKTLRVGGAALEPNRLYRVAVSDFLAQGGEGLAALIAELGETGVEMLDVQMRDALIAQLRREFAAPIP